MNIDVKVGDVTIANNLPFVLIAGPCQLESLQHSLMIAETLRDMCRNLGIGYIFKGSFDKANRTSIRSPRGLGLDLGLGILNEVRERLNVPVTTDVHQPYQCELVRGSVDLIQIPAFLCRQTDLLLAAAKYGKPVNVKKGQFIDPVDMGDVVEKIESADNTNILLTERGTSFGYRDNVVDMRSLHMMKSVGYPVIMDATHSVGHSAFTPLIARAAVAVGVAGIFMEVHQDPHNAPSDGKVMYRLDEMSTLLAQLVSIDRLVK